MIHYTYCRIGVEETASGQAEYKDLATRPILWASFCAEYKSKALREFHQRKYGYQIFVISIQ